MKLPFHLVNLFLYSRPLDEHIFNPKNHQLRHSRVGGNPVNLLIRLDSRLRGNDGNWGFYINSGQFSFVQRSQFSILGVFSLLVRVAVGGANQARKEELFSAFISCLS